MMFFATVRVAFEARPAVKSTNPVSPVADVPCAVIAPLMRMAPPASAVTSPPPLMPLTSMLPFNVRSRPALQSKIPPSPAAPPLCMMMEPASTMLPSSEPIVFGSLSPESKKTVPPEPSKLPPPFAWMNVPLPMTCSSPIALASKSPPSPPEVSASLPFNFMTALLMLMVSVPPGTTPPSTSSPAANVIVPPKPPPTRLLTSTVFVMLIESPASISTEPPSLPPPVASIGWVMVTSRAARIEASPPAAWLLPVNVMLPFTSTLPVSDVTFAIPPSENRPPSSTKLLMPTPARVAPF
jgi:hypothetical protein